LRIFKVLLTNSNTALDLAAFTGIMQRSHASPALTVVRGILPVGVPASLKLHQTKI